MASCTKCGVFNEYQDGPYVCRGCTGGAAEGETVIYNTPAERLALVTAAYESGILPDLSVAGGVSVTEQLAALDAEILVAVQKLAEPQYNTGNVDSYRRALLHNMTILGTRRAMLTANQKDLARARDALRRLRAAEKEASGALQSFPKAVQDRLVNESWETE